MKRKGIEATMSNGNKVSDRSATSMRFAGATGRIVCALVAALSVAMWLAPVSAHADCGSTVSGAVDRMMDLQLKAGLKEGGDKMTPEMKKMAEDMANEMKPKMKAAMSKSCTEDKWSAAALKCMDDAKTMDEMEKCEAKLTPEQKKNMDEAMNEAMGMGGLSAEQTCATAASQSALVLLGLASPPTKAAKSDLDGRRKVLASLRADLAAACTDRRWSHELMSCFAGAKRLDEWTTCRQTIDAATREKLLPIERRALATVGCTRTTDSSVERMVKAQLDQGGLTADARKDAESASEAIKVALKVGLAESCVADWWAADVLKCMDAAKSSQAMEKCESKLSSLQRADVDSVTTFWMGQGTTPENAVALPKECTEYKAAVERLATCDKLPTQARDALKQAYDDAAASWANLPAERRSGLAESCKTGRDAVIASAKSVCR